MERNKNLARRVREVLLDGTWIANTNYQQELSNVSLAQALATDGSHNSIAALTFHINYYLKGVLQVFLGGTLDISDHFSFDLPSLNTENEWRALIRDLLENAGQFADAVAQMDDKKLDSIFVKEEYNTYQRNIDGLIEHSYYHLGQIVLLKKMQGLRSL